MTYTEDDWCGTPVHQGRVCQRPQAHEGQHSTILTDKDLNELNRSDYTKTRDLSGAHIGRQVWVMLVGEAMPHWRTIVGVRQNRSTVNVYVKGQKKALTFPTGYTLLVSRH